VSILKFYIELALISRSPRLFRIVALNVIEVCFVTNPNARPPIQRSRLLANVLLCSLQEPTVLLEFERFGRRGYISVRCDDLFTGQIRHCRKKTRKAHTGTLQMVQLASYNIAHGEVTCRHFKSFIGN
jgi:hypothetical protein